MVGDSRDTIKTTMQRPKNPARQHNAMVSLNLMREADVPMTVLPLRKVVFFKKNLFFGGTKKKKLVGEENPSLVHFFFNS